MGIDDEIRATQNRLQSEMREAERKKRLEEQMIMWRRSTSMNESCPFPLQPDTQLQSLMNELMYKAKFNSGKISSVAPNGIKYVRKPNKDERPNEYTFDVIVSSIGSGKDLKEYSLWFFRDGSVCYVYNNTNSDRTNFHDYNLIRQRMLEAIALQGMDSKGNIIGRNTGSGGKSGCYIATAVYGSYDCPEVWTLRRFRDYKLLTNPLGRGFVRFYYATSPKLVKWFGKSKWFSHLWLSVLNRMVNELNKKGYSNSKYDDMR